MKEKSKMKERSIEERAVNSDDMIEHLFYSANSIERVKGVIKTVKSVVDKTSTTKPKARIEEVKWFYYSPFGAVEIETVNQRRDMFLDHAAEYFEQYEDDDDETVYTDDIVINYDFKDDEIKKFKTFLDL